MAEPETGHHVLDLAKREDILPGLRQVRWDLVIVDEAHRMSASDETHKSQRYRLGELLRDSADNLLLLTATPHKGDPLNFTLFLQLLDRDAYADVKSIREAMERRRAPFYLRRTKEAMVYFPERQPDGAWAAQPVFTKRITRTVDFAIDGDEFTLYEEVTRFVKRQSARAAAQGDDRRARAVGFLMSLYQRRLASSAYAMRRSLENRARRLEDGLKQAQELARAAPPDLPDLEDLEEMEDAERERLERMLEAVTLAGNAEEVRREIARTAWPRRTCDVRRGIGGRSEADQAQGDTTRAGVLRGRRPATADFTEFKDTLDYLMERLKAWGFRVGSIHGGMKPGSRDEPGSRLYTEQQFRDGDIQVLVATEAAGEGINLQCCTSSSTMTFHGTRTDWNSAWAASTATGSVSTASSSISSPPTPLRGECSSDSCPSSRRSGTLWTTTQCLTWSARSCPPPMWNASCGTTMQAVWETQTWKIDSCGT